MLAQAHVGTGSCEEIEPRDSMHYCGIDERG
jgi:hypothetical protein